MGSSASKDNAQNKEHENSKFEKNKKSVFDPDKGLFI